MAKLRGATVRLLGAKAKLRGVMARCLDVPANVLGVMAIFLGVMAIFLGVMARVCLLHLEATELQLTQAHRLCPGTAPPQETGQAQQSVMKVCHARQVQLDLALD